MKKQKELDNLTKDCIRARMLGYSSYGKYKVDHPHTKEKEDESLDPQETAQCYYCYGKFVPIRKGVKFCSQKCREKYRYKMSRSREIPIVMV